MATSIFIIRNGDFEVSSKVEVDKNIQPILIDINKEDTNRQDLTRKDEIMQRFYKCSARGKSVGEDPDDESSVVVNQLRKDRRIVEDVICRKERSNGREEDGTAILG